MRCAINDVNDYCAFWIYTKSEMWKFINSNYFVLRKNKAYGIRETQGMGFTRYYKSTLIVTSRLCLFHYASMPHQITSRASRLVGALRRLIFVCAPSARSARTN